MAVDVGTLVMKFESDDKKLRKSIVSLTKGMVGLSAAGVAALTGIGVASVKTAAEFDKGMSKVKAITDSTDEQMKELEQTAKDLGASTAFSAKEAADGMAFLGMAGFDTNEIIAAMPGLLDLAAASGTDLARTADIVSDAMSAFKLEAKESGMFADVLAKASSRANVSVETLGESFKFAAPVAGALGFSVQDVTAALGVMGNKGIKASQAGTTMRRALVEIASSAENADSELSKLAGGLTNADGTMRDLDQIILGLQDSFAGMSQAQKASSAESLFGKTAMSGMLAVLDDTTGAFSELVDELDNAEGASAKMAETMLDNLSGQMTLLKSATEGVAIEIGQVLIPILLDFVKFVQSSMPMIKDFFVTTFSTIVGVIDMFRSQIETGQGVIGMFVSKIQELLPVAKNIFESVFSAVVTAAESVWSFFETNLLPGFIKIVDWAREFMPVLASKFMDAFKIVLDVANTVWVFFRDNILPIFVELWDWVSSNMPLFQETFEKVWDAVLKVVTRVWDFFKENLLPMFEVLFKWVQDNMPLIQSVVEGAFKLIGIAFEAVAEVVSLLLDGLEALWKFMEPVFGAMADVVGDAMTDIVDLVGDVIEVFRILFGWVKDATTALKEFFSVKGSGDLSVPDTTESGRTKASSGKPNNVIRGNRAAGGPVKAGESYVVGEREAEVFTPSTDGFISAGGGGSYTININGAQDVNAIMSQVVRVLNMQGITNTGR